MNQFEKCLIHLCLLPIALINRIQKLIITNIARILVCYLYYALTLLIAFYIAIFLTEHILHFNTIFSIFDDVLQSTLYVFISLLMLICIQFITCKIIIYLQNKHELIIFTEKTVIVMKYITILISSIIVVFLLSIKTSLFTYLWIHYQEIHISDKSTTNLLWDLLIGTFQVTNIIFSIFITYLKEKLTFNPNFRKNDTK